VLQGFTLCKIEGLYTGDKYMRVDSDDQPFVFGMSFDKTFFSRDDCEGRLQQGLIILLFIMTWANVSVDDILEEILRHNPPCLAGISHELIIAAVKNIKLIAWFMHHDVLTMHMAVGEACFKSYPKDTAPQKKHLSGHSFGVLLFNPSALQDVQNPPIDIQFFRTHFESALHIVEATGW
jgi:hypothetical protein